MSFTVYEIITGQIIAQLENDVAPWRQPWSVGLPKNLVSGKVYRGINLFLLSTAGCEYFLTRNQAEELGGTIRCKGLPVVFWKMLERENKKTGEKELTPFMRFYRTPMRNALVHLNLLDHDRPSNAAILLFGTQPQRFLLSSEVKCLHFHGTQVRKPIPSYQVYKGDLFQLVDSAIDFVMGKLNRAVGTRALSNDAPVTYEIPRDAVAEAIVNAIAHRDYSSNASVQVMLFSDRLEVWNPGSLPPSLTIDSLRRPHASVPHNPLIAESLFLTRIVERAGSGILDMIELCAEFGLRPPEFRQDAGSFIQTLWRPVQSGSTEESVTAQVGTKLALSQHQVDVLSNCLENSELYKLMSIVGRSDRTKFRHQVLNPLITAGLIEMTIPDKPRSSKQKYRITEKGRTWLTERR